MSCGARALEQQLRKAGVHFLGRDTYDFRGASTLHVGSSSDLQFATTMTVRALVLAMLGFSGLFAMQGCGGSPKTTAAPSEDETTAAAAETTDEPETAPTEATTASP